MSIITIEKKILEKNDEIAEKNRQLFKEQNVFALNMISAPGSGKTSLLEQTLKVLRKKISMAVIEGDVQTDIDARRVAEYGVPAIQIITRGGCHLEANLVHEALTKITLSGINLLFIENVGNLVCPANYDLGENNKVVIVSTTEGDDKPLKYPGIFRHAAVLIINKTDLLPYVNCNIEQLSSNALSVNPNLTIFLLSCITGEGVTQWCDWLFQQTATSS